MKAAQMVECGEADKVKVLVITKPTDIRETGGGCDRLPAVSLMVEYAGRTEPHFT